MHEVNITELRRHLSKYLKSAQRGAEILVRSRGCIIARIIPSVDTKTDALRQLKELRQHCLVGDVISSVYVNWESQK